MGMHHRLPRPLLALAALALVANTSPDSYPERRPAGASNFARCGSGPRVSCVVDGDTFWYRGEKIRIADINTPEVSEPHCPAEARLGERATRRLVALLNQGPFTLERADRDTDRYGRLLRIVTRNGESLGEVLVAEGLAERWKGYRGSWC
jgi:endonuclease YncB( thermonuclease family)